MPGPSSKDRLLSTTGSNSSRGQAPSVCDSHGAATRYLSVRSWKVVAKAPSSVTLVSVVAVTSAVSPLCSVQPVRSYSRMQTTRLPPMLDHDGSSNLLPSLPSPWPRKLASVSSVMLLPPLYGLAILAIGADRRRPSV